MKYLALAALIGLIGVGVFGFAGMRHDMSHGSDCIASTLNNNVICPQNALSAAFYHIAAYKSFSQTTLVVSTFITLLIALLTLIAAAASAWLAPIPILSAPLVLRRMDERGTREERLVRWLSRFENSPPVRCGA